MVHRPHIILVTPALASANNGNWHTAHRWARLLGAAYRVTLTDDGRGLQGDLMIALHARRSASSIQAWAATMPHQPLVVVLTGTDLYRDIAVDAQAQRSLQLADRLLVLNELGAQALPEAWREKTRVVLQSCSERRPLAKPTRHLRALMLGHLREEKDPQTYWRAVQRLQPRPDFRFDHVGAALDPALGAQAQTLQAQLPRFRWLGGLPPAQARRRLQAAHVLVHASRMEGGAHVVIEALRSGTAVLASRIDGNVGLLGAEHPGLFETGDDAALAALLLRCRDDPTMLPALLAHGATRASLFAPAREQSALLQVLQELLPASAGPDPSSPKARA
jgi:putative glycosyltransferase (TIGR04348 family)